MRFACVIGVLWLASSVAAGAQTLPKEYAQFMTKDYQELMTAMTAAQAKAIRPGDEALSCAAVEKELVALMNDAAVQGYAAKMAGVAQKEAANKAMTPQAAAALFGALGPGAAMPLGTAGLQAQAAQQQALQALQDPTAQLKLIMPILPQMMRAQHLVGLALAQSCPSILGAFTGTLAQPLRGVPPR